MLHESNMSGYRKPLRPLIRGATSSLMLPYSLLRVGVYVIFTNFTNFTNTSMKKVKIKHIAKKSGISKSSLQALFFDNHLIKDAKEKRIKKDIAKTFLRDMQWINPYGYSKTAFLDDFGLSNRFYTIFGILWLWGLLGLFATLGQQWYYPIDMWGSTTHQVASVSNLAGHDVASIPDGDQWLTLFGDPVMMEVSDSSMWELLLDDDSDATEFEWFGHFVAPESLPATGA